MIFTDQPIFDAMAAATQIDKGPDGVSRIVMSASKFIEVFNNHRDRALCTSLNVPAQYAPIYEGIRWQRVNDEPFEYAIQQGPHGDEFVKLFSGRCLRRTAVTSTERCDGADDLEHLDGMLDDRERG